MANASIEPSPIALRFDAARREFLENFSEEEVRQFSDFTSIDDVYNATDEIQKKQAETQTLKRLSKIQPYLECLEQYHGVVDTIVQIKPDFLAVIWAPLKMLLVISSTYMKSYTKVIDSLAQIGATLPQFKTYAHLFRHNASIQRVLELFFRDILDFHLVALQFFRLKHWRVLFESLWPKYSSKFQVVLNNISHHRNLMDGETTLLHITEAHAARTFAYEKHAKDQERDERIEFQLIKNSMSPQFYDTILERINQRCLVRSGAWLEENQQFVEWCGPNNQSVRTLWLTGIPGAGKTFLSSIIINRLREASDESTVTFAILGHQSSQEGITLTVLHSLLFQIITDNKALRPVVVHNFESNNRKLMSSQIFVQELIKSLLTDLPTVFFIVDGLDEIVDSERPTLLGSLQTLQRESSNLRLLISSRAEYDIDMTFGAQCHRIHVHYWNSNDIAEYVALRMRKWLAGLRVNPEVNTDVQDCTREISRKSEGMFLYARLVCDSLEHISNPDDFGKEVQNLPQGLKEAYGRILERINRDLTSLERAQTKAILEWVSCSSIPLRENEIQLALSVADNRNILEGSREALLNVIRRCGPIVEIVDDSIYFVHFSAKEYLLSTQSDKYLNNFHSNMNVATTCLKYLRSECFDPELSDDKLRDGILRGAYILQEYAISHWIEHAMRASICGLPSNLIEQLSNEIEETLTLRANSALEASQITCITPRSLTIFKKHFSRTSISLLRISVFLQKRKRELSIFEGENWINQDPLTVSATQVRTYRILESMLCASPIHIEDCQCNTIKNIYGSRPFKCNRFGCSLFRIGFEHAKDRDTHIKTHDRPYLCNWAECEFGRIGFSSETRLNVHLRHHQKDQLPNQVLEERAEDYGDFMEDFLLDAVKTDNLDSIRRFRATVPRFVESLMRQAVKSASSAMLELLLDASDDLNVTELVVLPWAVEANNLEATQILLNRGFSVRQAKGNYTCIYLAMINKSAEMIRILLQHDSKELLSLEIFDPRVKQNLLLCLISHESEPECDERVIACLSLLRSWVYEQDDYSSAFKINAYRGCSIAIAKYLLQIGVDVNTSGRYAGYTRRTALWEASKKRSQNAAEFMKFLLESGANPNVKPPRAKIALSDRPGPKNISKWFGISWEQLVEESQKKYEESQGELDDE